MQFTYKSKYANAVARKMGWRHMAYATNIKTVARNGIAVVTYCMPTGMQYTHVVNVATLAIATYTK